MKRVIAMSAVITLTPLLAACGGSDADKYADKSVKQIGADAQKAMQGLKSVHVRADGKSEGKPLKLDMAVGQKGVCSGELAQGGQSMNVLSDGKATYVKAGADFWEAQGGGELGKAFADKWVTGMPSDSFGEFCSVDELFSDFDLDTDKSKGKVTGTAKVGGQDVVIIKGKDDDGNPVAMKVAASEPHYVVSAVGSEDGEDFMMTFSDFDEPVDVTAPKDAVDLGSFAQ